jgi:hypothetical protein
MQPTGPGSDDVDRTETLETIDSADRPPGGASRWRRVATAGVAVLALVAAGAFGAALASGSDGTDGSAALPAASSDEDDDDPWDRMERFREWAEENGPGMLRGRGHAFAPGFGHGLLGGALHGEYVVPDGDGGYQTVVSQRGEATAVSATSLTVASEDGFSQTYRIDDDTLVMGGTDGVEAIDEGDQVSVRGVRSGGSVRAVHVTDLSAFDWLREQRRGPTPSPDSTTEGTAADV